MIKSEDGIKRRGDFFWSVGDFSFEKDTIGHIFTGHYYVFHNDQMKRYNRKTVIYKTLHRKLKIEEQEQNEKPEMNSDVLEG